MKSMRKVAEGYGVPTAGPLIIAGLIVNLLALPRVAVAVAPIIVGDGTAESCTELALRTALVRAETDGGGTIRFSCGAIPVTIALVADPTLGFVPLIIANNTTIDGGGMVTLHLPAYNFLDTIVIPVDATVGLKRLTIGGASFGSTVLNSGTLIVEGCVFSDNNATAIRNDATLFVKNTAFSNNGRVSTIGVAIQNFGYASVDQSAFIRNFANSAGGAIYNGNTGTLEVKSSFFSDNFGRIGGAIYNDGALVILNSDFSDNLTIFAGAGIHSAGSLQIKNSTFSRNVGQGRDGGSGIHNSGLLTVDNCDFRDNVAYWGGAITTRGGSLLVNNSWFSGNRAIEVGGAIYITGSDAVTITNSTITENVATYDGGGIYVVSSTSPTLLHTSVTGNTPNDIGVQP